MRPARVEDRERLLELWEHSIRTTHHFLGDSDVVALRPLVAEELASDAVDWWVLVFYKALEFSVVRRSPTDAGGWAFPMLHMKRAAPGAAGGVATDGATGVRLCAPGTTRCGG